MLILSLRVTVMIAWLSQKLADLFVTSGAVPADDRDVYVYGLDVLISTAASVLCVLVIGIIAGRLLITVIFLACFIALRSAAGGFHASTHFRCFLIMLGAYAAAVLPTFFLEAGLLAWAALPMAAASLAVVIALAPAPHENRPVTPAGLKRFRALSLWLAGGEAAAAAACFGLGLIGPAYAVAAGMLTAAASLCAARAQARGTPKTSISENC